MEWEIFWLHRVIDIEDWAIAKRSGNGGYVLFKKQWLSFKQELKRNYRRRRGEVATRNMKSCPPRERRWTSFRWAFREALRDYPGCRDYGCKEYEYFANKVFKEYK